jgi:hypothetical protein
MAREEFSDQITFKTPLKRSEQEVDSSAARDKEKNLGERHGASPVYTLGDPPGDEYGQRLGSQYMFPVGTPRGALACSATDYAVPTRASLPQRRYLRVTVEWVSCSGAFIVSAVRSHFGADPHSAAWFQLVPAEGVQAHRRRSPELDSGAQSLHVRPFTVVTAI